jgi:hypothetical protein
MEPKVVFTLEEIGDEDTGTTKLSLVKTTEGNREVWCSVEDIDQLFNSCVKRWRNNWDLIKVCVAIEESGID